MESCEGREGHHEGYECYSTRRRWAVRWGRIHLCGRDGEEHAEGQLGATEGKLANNNDALAQRSEAGTGPELRIVITRIYPSCHPLLLSCFQVSGK